MKAKNSFKWLTPVLLIVGMLWVAPSLIVGQDQDERQQSETTDSKNQEATGTIELMDANGRKVTARVLLGDSGWGAKLGGRVQQELDIDGGKLLKAKMVGDQILVVDEEGNERVIQPQSTMVTQSQRTVIENGVEETEKIFRKIVVDADGNRYEVEMPKGAIDGLPGVITPQPPLFSWTYTQPQNANRFMIGLLAEPVNESLAAHLNIEENTGLLVTQVMEDSPAAVAGIQKHDILVYAEESGLKSLTDLSQAVEQAGEAEQPLSMILIRRGVEQAIEVKPQLRTESENGFGIEMQEGGVFPFRRQMMFQPRFDFQQIEPGMVLDLEGLSDDETLGSKMQELLQKMLDKPQLGQDADFQTFRDQARQEFEAVRQRAREAAEQSQLQFKQMQEEFQKLRKELELLRRQDDSNN